MQYATRVPLYHSFTPTKSLTAVGTNGWPFFYLNTPFKANKMMDLNFWLSRNFNRLLGASGAQFIKMTWAGYYARVVISFECPYEVLNSYRQQWVALL